MTKEEQIATLEKLNTDQAKTLQELFLTINKHEAILSDMKKCYNEWRTRHEYRKLQVEELKKQCKQ